MKDASGFHPFSAVDEQPDVDCWMQTLDRLSQHPFYRTYKARVAEQLDPVEGGEYLEVGAGLGTDALAVAESSLARVFGVDRSVNMVAAARQAGLRGCVADAEALPFFASAFDGFWADRTFQHVADPERALVEAVRVVRSGGRVVVADPDYSTQTLVFPEPALSSAVLGYRERFGLRHGALAGRMGDLMRAVGLVGIEADELRLTVRDPEELDGCLGLRSWAEGARRRGLLDDEDVARWYRLFDQTAVSGDFAWSVSFFVTKGSKP